jgi:hypothetical protein
MNSSTELYIELYKRKQFDKIPVYYDNGVFYYLFKAQLKALEYLWENTCFYVGYGGSGMSGKTQLECFYATFNSLAYPDTRWMIGRTELKNLKATTIQTLLKTFAFYGLVFNQDYYWNDKESYYYFNNTSRIICRDTKYYPSDPLFTELGGLEITGAILDESVENTINVINILTTRVNRWNNLKYNIPAKILEGFNPAKNHVNERYWKPYKENRETKDTKFVRALCTDNPHPEAKTWAENVLKTGDKQTIERLYYGNFDYDDDDNNLLTYDKIMDCFTNSFVEPGERFISSDIAITNDKFVAIAWEGLRVKEIVAINNASKPVETMSDGVMTRIVDYTPLKKEFDRLAVKWQVPRSNICYDADGIGKDVKDFMSGAVGLHTGQRSVYPEYFNLRSELLCKLAEVINANLCYFDCYIEPRLKETIINELGLIKRISEPGEKIRIISTAEMKAIINHSPDVLMALAYRMLFVLTRKK